MAHAAMPYHAVYIEHLPCYQGYNIITYIDSYRFD